MLYRTLSFVFAMKRIFSTFKCSLEIILKCGKTKTSTLQVSRIGNECVPIGSESEEQHQSNGMYVFRSRSTLQCPQRETLLFANQNMNMKICRGKCIAGIIMMIFCATRWLPCSLFLINSVHAQGDSHIILQHVRKHLVSITKPAVTQ